MFKGSCHHVQLKMATSSDFVSGQKNHMVCSYEAKAERDGLTSGRVVAVLYLLCHFSSESSTICEQRNFLDFIRWVTVPWEVWLRTF